MAMDPYKVESYYLADPPTGLGMSVTRCADGVTVTHVPSGLSVSCHKHASLIKNRADCVRAITAMLKEPVDAEES